MIVRLATEADLEAMTAVLVGASPLDPVYPYRFPDRHLYPDAFAALCRQKCAEYLETSTVVVCEMPTNPSTTTTTTQVVAFSAWDMPTSLSQRAATPTPSPTNPTHPHSRPATPPTPLGHLTRQSAFRAAVTKHKALLFDNPTTAPFRNINAAGQGHVFLKILLTHPSHQRRGAGTALTRWGIEQARRRGLYTTVFASPMGLALYRRLGFWEVGRFQVRLEGEDEFLEIPALVLGPAGSRGEGVVEEGGLDGGLVASRVGVACA